MIEFIIEISKKELDELKREQSPNFLVNQITNNSIKTRRKEINEFKYLVRRYEGSNVETISELLGN